MSTNPKKRIVGSTADSDGKRLHTTTITTTYTLEDLPLVAFLSLFERSIEAFKYLRVFFVLNTSIHKLCKIYMNSLSVVDISNYDDYVFKRCLNFGDSGWSCAKFIKFLSSYTSNIKCLFLPYNKMIDNKSLAQFCTKNPVSKIRCNLLIGASLPENVLEKMEGAVINRLSHVDSKYILIMQHLTRLQLENCTITFSNNHNFQPLKNITHLKIANVRGEIHELFDSNSPLKIVKGEFAGLPETFFQHNLEKVVIYDTIPIKKAENFLSVAKLWQKSLKYIDCCIRWRRQNVEKLLKILVCAPLHTLKINLKFEEEFGVIQSVESIIVPTVKTLCLKSTTLEMSHQRLVHQIFPFVTRAEFKISSVVFQPLFANLTQLKVGLKNITENMCKSLVDSLLVIKSLSLEIDQGNIVIHSNTLEVLFVNGEIDLKIEDCENLRELHLDCKSLTIANANSTPNVTAVHLAVEENYFVQAINQLWHYCPNLELLASLPSKVEEYSDLYKKATLLLQQATQESQTTLPTYLFACEEPHTHLTMVVEMFRDILNTTNTIPPYSVFWQKHPYIQNVPPEQQNTPCLPFNSMMRMNAYFDENKSDPEKIVVCESDDEDSTIYANFSSFSEMAVENWLSEWRAANYDSDFVRKNKNPVHKKFRILHFVYCNVRCEEHNFL